VPTGEGEHVLKFEESEKMFDPKKVYGDAPNPTIL
jgi:phosphoribosyl-AMP cyclohydrolase